MKILIKNEVLFISAEFSMFLLGSSSGYNSYVAWGWCKSIQMLSILALGSLFEATSNPQFEAVSFGLGCIWDGPHCSKSLYICQYRAQGWVN